MIRDLTGQRFGRLEVIEYTGKKSEPGHNAIWLCKCDCGKYLEVRGCYLTTTRRPQKSCGCKYVAEIGFVDGKHGGCNERLYRIWTGMKRRCEGKNAKDYPRYGGRGIKVCNEWKDYNVFRKWALSAGYDETLEAKYCSLDRIDPNGNYEPDNCRWVDMKTQENNRRNNRLIEYNGKTQSVSMWADELGIDLALLQDRLRHGWDFERAVTQPRQKKHKGEHIGTKINQYTLEGEFVKQWKNATTIQRETRMHGANIVKCCEGERLTANGFKWQFAI